MDESAISVKSRKAVAGWLAGASDRQLGAATTIACFRPIAVFEQDRQQLSQAHTPTVVTWRVVNVVLLPVLRQLGA